MGGGEQDNPLGSTTRRLASEQVEAGAQEAEFVALGIGEDVPRGVGGLADIDVGGAGGQDASEFGGAGRGRWS